MLQSIEFPNTGKACIDLPQFFNEDMISRDETLKYLLVYTTRGANNM